jgi:hypothetical protein
MSHILLAMNRLAIPLLLLAIRGCGAGSSASAAAQIKRFSRDARIKLPASAKPLLYCEAADEAKQSAWLSFALPTEAVEPFLNASPFYGVALRSNDKYYTGDFSVLWESPPPQHRTGQRKLVNSQILHLLIDDGNPTTATIYLLWQKN